MNPDAVEHGLVAKRGLPADLHSPIPPARRRPVSRNSGPIAHETPGVAISQLTGINTTAATNTADELVGCANWYRSQTPAKPLLAKEA
jgi:hypothetical protein